MIKWNWLVQSMLQIMQFAIAMSLLILALDWVLGDGSQRAWMAVLGVMRWKIWTGLTVSLREAMALA